MSDLINRIKNLEDKEHALEELTNYILNLQDFVNAWDSEDPNKLPLDHKEKIQPIRKLIGLASVINKNKEHLLQGVRLTR